MKSRFFAYLCFILTLSLLFPSSVVKASPDLSDYPYYFISFDKSNGFYFSTNDFIVSNPYSCCYFVENDSLGAALYSSSPFSAYNVLTGNVEQAYLSHGYYYFSFGFGYSSPSYFCNLDVPIFSSVNDFNNFRRSGIDSGNHLPKKSLISSSFDGSITVDNITVKNETRYTQDLTYSVSFSGNDLIQKFESSILNSILNIGFETFYSLQVPSLSWLESTSSNISNFDYWYSLNANKSQLDVCNNFVSYTLRPADYVTDLGAAYNRQNIVANLSSYTSAIYGRSLSQTEQYLFDVLCYPRTVSVRSKWLLSSVFGYGPLKVVNIGPTRLNGDSLSYLGFDGYQVSDDSNSYDYAVEINSTSFNDTDVVISSDQNSTIEFISQDVINYNYNTYNDTINYYYGISTGSPIDVYVVNYKDFKDQVENNYIKNITRNFDINFGDLNIEPEINIGIYSGLDQIDVTVPSSSSILGKFAGSIPSDLSVLIFTFLGFAFIVAVLYHGSN